MNPDYYALLMMLLFFVVVIAVRVVIQYRITGNSGIRSGTSLKSSRQQYISYLMFAVLIVQLLLTVLFAFSRIEAQVKFGPIGSVLGLILCLAGIVFTSYSQIVMGKEWRIGVDPDEETRLVTTGIYGRIRNPIYTGCIVHGAGVVILAPHLLILCSGIVGFIAIKLYVKHIEEPYLISVHGEQYLQYMKRTGSFIPIP